MRTLINLGAVAAVLCCHAAARAERVDIELLGQQGAHIFMAIPRSHATNKKYIEQVARGLCLNKTHCYVSFWQKGEAAPRRFPITDKVASLQIASYRQNTVTGLSEMLWNCRRFPGTPDSACFT